MGTTVININLRRLIAGIPPLIVLGIAAFYPKILSVIGLVFCADGYSCSAFVLVVLFLMSIILGVFLSFMIVPFKWY